MDIARSIKSRKYMCQGQPMWRLKYQITSLYLQFTHALTHRLTYLPIHSLIHSEQTLVASIIPFQITPFVTVVFSVLQCFPSL